MKVKTLSMYVLMGLSYLSATAQANLSSTYSQMQSDKSMTINSVADLLAFQDKTSKNQKKIVDEMMAQQRLESLKEYAYGIALRASLNANISNIAKIIKENERNLDAIYNFEPLMLAGGRVIPPVIVEARDIYNQADNRQIRLSGAVYDIYEQAMFSSVAPNWREYLVFADENSLYHTDFNPLEYTTGGFQPKTNQEKLAWVKASEKGWQDGLQQANNLFQSAFDNLNRDYTGMIRYHEFVAKGKINLPVVNRYDMYDINDGQRLVLDEKLLQIVVLPEFKELPLPKETKSGNDFMTRTMIKPNVVEQNQQPSLLENATLEMRKLNHAINERVVKDKKPMELPFDERTPQLVKPSQISLYNEPVSIQTKKDLKFSNELVLPQSKPMPQGISQNDLREPNSNEPVQKGFIDYQHINIKDVGTKPKSIKPKKSLFNRKVPTLSSALEKPSAEIATERLMRAKQATANETPKDFNQAMASYPNHQLGLMEVPNVPLYQEKSANIAKDRLIADKIKSEQEQSNKQVTVTQGVITEIDEQALLPVVKENIETTTIVNSEYSTTTITRRIIPNSEISNYESTSD